MKISFKISELKKLAKKYINHNELINEVITLLEFYKKDINACNDNYKKTIKGIIESRKFFVDKSGNLLTRYGDSLEDEDIRDSLQKYLESLSAFKDLSFLKYTKKNAVFVGANGSGKTTLIRKLNNSLDSDDILFFSADRMLSICGINVSADSFKGIKENINFAYKKAIGFDDGSVEYSSKLFYLYIKLLKETRFDELNRQVNGNSYKIIKKWNELIKTRELFYDHELYAKPTGSKNDSKYDIKYLSSGEKSILFFLMVILLNDEKSYYFIDEPENNLNPAIVSEIWDYLESERPKSVFVYLTHDNNFAVSRVNCTEYWMKNFNGNSWYYEEIPEEGDLPKDLLIELLGSKQPTIFCESEDKSKLDYIFFKIFYPEYNVVPCGGCDKVISYVKAYRLLQLPKKVYGIIDCDYKDDEYLNALTKENVFHLPYFEIENLLMSEPLLSGVIKSINEQEHRTLLNKIKGFVKAKFISLKDIWIVRHIAFDLRDKFDYHSKIKLLNNISDFKKMYKCERLDDADIDALANKYEKLFDELVNKDDYDTFLKHLDYKGLIKDCEKLLKLQSKHSYVNILISFLKTDNGRKEINYLRNEISNEL